MERFHLKSYRQRVCYCLTHLRILQLVLTAMLFFGNGYAQEWQVVSQEAFKEVMAKGSAQNNRENYSLEFKRSVYANATDPKPISFSAGRLLRGKGKEYRLESENQLLIQNGDVKMVIDSAEKLILLMKPDTLFDQVSPEKMFEKGDFKSSQFFHQKAGTTNKYRIQFEAGTSAYQNMEFTLDAKTNAVLKVEFKLVAGNYVSNDFEDHTEEEPRVVVEYKPMTTLKSGGAFDLTPWLKRSGEKYELQPQINFTLDDLRIN